MKFPGYIERSIGLMQAALLLLSSIVIGFSLSVWEMRAALIEQRLEVAAHVQELISLAEASAARAAWALDTDLAREVASGIANQPGVQSIEIRALLRGEVDERLVRLENPLQAAGTLVSWIARRYFSEVSSRSRQLSVSNQGRDEVVGRIIVELSPRFAASSLLSRFYSTLTVSLIEAFLIGFVLLCLAQWLITAPLRRAAATIAQIEPESLDDTNYSLTIPRLHQNDEIGQLLDHTNKLLDRLVDSRKELRRLATRDPLTNLPNRTLIQEHLASLLASAERASRHVAVIFIDLDRFKKVNDSLGHDIGDRLLQRVAITLLEQVREEDSVGRLGGDEFLVVLPVDNIKPVIAVVRRILDALSTPCQIEGHNLRTNASLGIAIFPEDGSSAEVLMRRADLAMYKAKSDPAVKWHLFSEDMSQAVDFGMAMESALAGAIERNELEIYLQPQFDAKHMQLAASEALLRWSYKGQAIAPVEFIDIAETSGLILEIGDWVIEQACRILKRWGDRASPISVNVSGRQLAEAGFVARVLEIVRKYEVDPGLLAIEITETILMHNLDQSFEKLNLLRKQGIQVSIDDFGTGYSSLAYLTRLPIDEFKIDRSFVSGSQHSAVVLSTIVAMGRALKIHVVAEGVETDEQRKELADCGCDLLQGYLLGRPMPVDEFEDLFNLVGGASVYPISSH